VAIAVRLFAKLLAEQVAQPRSRWSCWNGSVMLRARWTTSMPAVRPAQTIDHYLLWRCIDGSAKLAGEGHGTSADWVARVELSCADFSPDGVEQLGEAIKCQWLSDRD
jgi:hypothetical protein